MKDIKFVPFLYEFLSQTTGIGKGHLLACHPSKYSLLDAVHFSLVQKHFG